MAVSIHILFLHPYFRPMDYISSMNSSHNILFTRRVQPYSNLKIEQQMTGKIIAPINVPVTLMQTENRQLNEVW